MAEGKVTTLIDMEGTPVAPRTVASAVVTKSGKNIEELLTHSDIPFQFGIDENGNYGYIKAGADTVTPFKNLSSLKQVYTYTQASAKNGENSIIISGLGVTEAIIVVWFQYTGTGSGSTGVRCSINGVSGADYTKLLGQTEDNQGYTFCLGLLNNMTGSVTITTDHNQSNVHAKVGVDIFAL